MFLDSSGLFCVHNTADPHHAEAVDYLDTASIRITHSYVLSELVALAQARRLPREPLLQFVAELQEGELEEIVYVDEDLHRIALEFLMQRLDKEWSLCDAVSFVLMETRKETEALTTDHHFEQAGFIRLLKP